MEEGRSRLAVIVLAAGAGTRFSDEPGAKLLAPLEGRPVLAHVLAAVGTIRPRETVVVLGSGAQAIERSIEWEGARRVINPQPERGIGSSIATGILALVDSDNELDGAFIVLGDQPRLRPDVLEALARHARDSSTSIVVPRYVDDPGPRNPVLLMRAAWPLVHELDGDHGLGALIAARPELADEVDVPGAMPDVDVPEDLATMVNEKPLL
jgi:molybdenum cofactor cytidylyltransferase